jgi:hypothetical protein
MAIPDLAPPTKSDKPETNWSILSNWFYLLWKFVRTPALIGQPTTPTGAAGDSSTQIANDAFVQQELASAKNLAAMYGMAGVDGIAGDFPGVWIDTYVPTITAQTGTFTTVSATLRWKQSGKTVFVSAVITITTNGTAATGVLMTLPAPPKVMTCGFTGRANNITGKQLQAVSTGTSIYIVNYDNTYPGATGEALFISGMYETV